MGKYKVWIGPATGLAALVACSSESLSGIGTSGVFPATPSADAGSDAVSPIDAGQGTVPDDPFAPIFTPPDLRGDGAVDGASDAPYETPICGDGKLGIGEQCDDGNLLNGDGCAADCKLVEGWICPTPGVRCLAKLCGDGVRVALEQCDDKNSKSGDGCSSACEIEDGYKCVSGATASACTKTTCGDGNAEGFEQCDDGNLVPYDGCSPSCTLEPTCAGGNCTAVCGDGLRFSTEACDDGNTRNGDGCSATCTLEPAFSCSTVTEPPPDVLRIPILYRDFLYYGTTCGTVQGHPDFERYSNNVVTKGLVASTLGADGRPVFASTMGNASTPQLTSADAFFWWYHDARGAQSNPYASRVHLKADGTPQVLELGKSMAQGAVVYSLINAKFYPLENLGWNNPSGANCNQVSANNFSESRNFAFTSELHYPFTFQGGERFDFSGDDDVWVFINGKLAVDIGGLHPEKSDGINLDDAKDALGLVKGKVYEIAMFQAERHTNASNYKLTLTNFVKEKSVCTAICGDGIVAGAEECDEGAKNGSGYGHCLANCKLGAYCGDGAKNGPELCDNGVFNIPVTVYGQKGLCTSACKPSPHCGDGLVQTEFNEQCDGTKECNPDCTLVPR